MQRDMNVALGLLLTTRATIESHQRRLVSNTKPALHQDEAKTSKAIKKLKACCAAMIRTVEATCTKAIREAEASCADHILTLQLSHEESMPDMECEAIEKEGQDCQSFLESCRAVLQACPPEANGGLMYPLQLLIGNMSLPAVLVDTGHCNWRTYPCSSSDHVRDTCTPNGYQMIAMLIQPGGGLIKIWGGKSHGVRHDSRKWPYWRWKDERFLAKLLKDSHHETFDKDLDLVQVTRWAYFKAHCPEFDHENPHDLSHTFQEMANSTILLDPNVYEVWDVLTVQKHLHVAHCVARSCLRDIHFFWVVPPTESPKIIGLKGTHSPKVLKQQAGLSFCPWCEKEGQNEGTVANNLRTSHTTWALSAAGAWGISWPTPTQCTIMCSSAVQHRPAVMMTITMTVKKSGMPRMVKTMKISHSTRGIQNANLTLSQCSCYSNHKVGAQITQDPGWDPEDQDVTTPTLTIKVKLFKMLNDHLYSYLHDM